MDEAEMRHGRSMAEPGGQTLPLTKNGKKAGSGGFGPGIPTHFVKLNGLKDPQFPPWLTLADPLQVSVISLWRKERPSASSASSNIRGESTTRWTRMASRGNDCQTLQTLLEPQSPRAPHLYTTTVRSRSFASFHPKFESVHDPHTTVLRA